MHAALRLSCAAWQAQPTITSVTVCQSTAGLRATNARRAKAAGTSTRTPLSAPPQRPKGVRVASQAKAYEVMAAVGSAQLLCADKDSPLVLSAISSPVSRPSPTGLRSLVLSASVALAKAQAVVPNAKLSGTLLRCLRPPKPTFGYFSVPFMLRPAQINRWKLLK